MANCWARPAMGSSLPARSIHACCGGRRSDHPSAQGEKPMYAVPDVDQVVAVAKELGIHLSPEDAVLYRKHLIAPRSQLDAFVQARLEEPKTPIVSAARKPGWRWTREEDPINAWMWMCRIEGAAGGVLAGKAVS